MAQQLINVGAAPNDGLGDPLRTGGQKINLNFDELYELRNVYTVGLTGITLESATPADTKHTIKCTLNRLPINYRSIWTDFGGGNDTDSHGWNYNVSGELPNDPGMAIVLETPFTGLLEYWWSLHPPTAGAFTSWRAMGMHMVIATALAEMQFLFDKMQWFSHPEKNPNPAAQVVIDTEIERAYTTIPFGVGGPARNPGPDGPMFRVIGNSGAGNSFAVIQPTTMINFATAFEVIIDQVLGQADAHPCNFQGWGSNSCNWDFFQTHATALGRLHVRTLEGDSIVRCSTSTRNFSLGIDQSAGTAELANHYDMDTNALVTWNLTTNASKFWAPIGLPTYTVATLPSSATATQMIYVSDESGGAVPAFSDGANWRRVTDRAIVS